MPVESSGEVARLLSWAPLFPLDFVPVLAPRASAGEVADLVQAGHVGILRWPRATGPAWRLLYLTERGIAAAAAHHDVAPARLARARRLRRADLLHRIPEMRGVLATYELLACLAASWPIGARLVAWIAPWSVRVWRPTSKARVRLQAHAYVAWTTEDGVTARILWPDVGTQRVRDALGQLSALPDLHRERPGRAPTLMVAVPSVPRAQAWQDTLLEIAERRGLPPAPAQVRTWQQWRGDLHRAADTPRRALGHAPRPARWGSVRALSEVDERLLGDADDESGALARRAAALKPADWGLLVFLARHAFLTRTNLARVMGWTTRWAASAPARLVRLGLVQVLPSAVPRDRALECLEPGLRLAAASLGVPLSVAVHKLGFAGGGADHPIGRRASLARDLAHTVGCDGIFSWLLAYARTQRAMGCDEALGDWRNAAESQLRYGRPDGYGVYQLRGAGHGFFLEYDRGTEKLRDYEQKLAAYHLDLERGTYQRDYAGFPTILFVTEDAPSEERFAAAALTAQVGRPGRLPLLLTTVEALTTPPRGLREPIWRTAESAARLRWP